MRQAFFSFKNIEETGSTLLKPRNGRPGSTRTAECVESIKLYVREDPSISIWMHEVALMEQRTISHYVQRSGTASVQNVISAGVKTPDLNLDGIIFEE